MIRTIDSGTVNGTEVEPLKGLSFKTTVKGQDGLKGGIPVTVILDVNTTSGGHDHGETNAAVRPRGGLSGATACPATAPPHSVCATGTTSSQAPYIGEAWFNFRAPDPAGTHTFSATCAGCTNTASGSVDVKVGKLEPIPGSPFYALQDNAGNVIGAVRNKHSDNHYLTGTAIGKLQEFAKVYQKTVNPGAKLYLNDASLMWGGLFDVGVTNWTSPHAGHRNGVGLDVRAENSGPNNEGAVPTKFFANVSIEAKKAKAKAALHCTQNGVLKIGAPCNGIPNNRHFHVDF